MSRPTDADRQHEQIEQLEEIVDRQHEQIEQLEEIVDRQHERIEQLEETVDRQRDDTEQRQKTTDQRQGPFTGSLPSRRDVLSAAAGVAGLHALTGSATANTSHGSGPSYSSASGSMGTASQPISSVIARDIRAQSLTTDRSINDVQIAAPGEVQNAIDRAAQSPGGGKVELLPDEKYELTGSSLPIEVKEGVTLDFNGARVTPTYDNDLFAVYPDAKVVDPVVNYAKSGIDFTSAVFRFDNKYGNYWEKNAEVHGGKTVGKWADRVFQTASDTDHLTETRIPNLRENAPEELIYPDRNQPTNDNWDPPSHGTAFYLHTSPSMAPAPNADPPQRGPAIHNITVENHTVKDCYKAVDMFAEGWFIDGCDFDLTIENPMVGIHQRAEENGINPSSNSINRLLGWNYYDVTINPSGIGLEHVFIEHGKDTLIEGVLWDSHVIKNFLHIGPNAGRNNRIVTTSHKNVSGQRGRVVRDEKEDNTNGVFDWSLFHFTNRERQDDNTMHIGRSLTGYTTQPNGRGPSTKYGTPNQLGYGSGIDLVGANTTALGTFASTSGWGGVSVGHAADAGRTAVGVGQGTAAGGPASVAIGKGARTGDALTTAVGANTKITGRTGIAIGAQAEANADNAVSIGRRTTVDTEALARLGGGENPNGPYPSPRQFAFPVPDQRIVADADMQDNEITIEADESDAELTFRYKDSTGTIHTATLSYS